jgi:hypothetical protein
VNNRNEFANVSIQIEQRDRATASVTTALGGGSIVIQKN